MGRKPKAVPQQPFEESPHEVEEVSAPGALEIEEPEISVFRPDREGVRKVLGDLEADIMEYIWERVPATSPDGITVREVHESFWRQNYVAYTTIMTTMARLAKKHLLRARKVDKAFVYTPILTKEEFIDNFVQRILENLLVSFSDTTQSHLDNLATGKESAGRVQALKARVQARRSAGTDSPKPARTGGLEAEE